MYSLSRGLSGFSLSSPIPTNFTHLLYSRTQSVWLRVCVCVSRLLAPFIHKIFILHPSSEDGFYERENAVVACDNKSNNFAHCTATQHIPYRSVCCWVSSVALGHFICATPTEIHRINIVPIFFYERKRNFIQNIVSKFNQRKLIFFVHFISKKKKKIAR